MRQLPASLCDQQFIVAAATQQLRLDGRAPLQFRRRLVQLGASTGSCAVSCGASRVTAAVTCRLTRPRAVRPCEGTLHFSVQLMAGCGAPVRQTACLERLLEQCVRDAGCCDMESLCLQTDQLAWRVQVHVCVVQWGGAVASCAVQAAVTALHHHRRPPVTVSGAEVALCKDAEPVPLAILHTPFLMTFAFLPAPTEAPGEDSAASSLLLLADPSVEEERVMVGCLHVAVNSYRELCALQVSGPLLLRPDHVTRCCQLAIGHVVELHAALKLCRAEDRAVRLSAGGVLPCLADGLAPCDLKVTPAVPSKEELVMLDVKLEAHQKSPSHIDREVISVLSDEDDEDENLPLPTASGAGKAAEFADSDSEEEMQSVLKPELWDTGFV